jgi:hypothetical protein
MAGARNNQEASMGKRWGLLSAGIAMMLALTTGISWGEEEEPCKAPPEWFPKVSDETIKTLFELKRESSDECSFYQWSFATFLYVMEARDGGSPRFKNYDSFASLFHVPLSPAAPKADVNILSLSPRLQQQDNGADEFDGISQAGLNGVLVDRFGHPVFYAMHFNGDYKNFVVSNGFLDKEKLKKDGVNAIFPTGALELKSSWMLKPAQMTDAEFASRYLTVDASVASLKTDANGKIVLDPLHPILTKVGLLGLHVVGVVDDHPEFIWASFEHNGNAPLKVPEEDAGSANPVDPNTDYNLYKAGTSYRDSNPVPKVTPLVLAEDGTLSPTTSIYRAYYLGGDAAEDPAVADLNESAKSQLPKDSVLQNYKMIGAVWLKNRSDFIVDTDFEDDNKLVGEKKMSNTSMESFTQVSRPNCFSCHDTTAKRFMPASTLGISHALEKFLGLP